jgi:hypothetical protein
MALTPPCPRQPHKGSSKATPAPARAQYALNPAKRSLQFPVAVPLRDEEGAEVVEARPQAQAKRKDPRLAKAVNIRKGKCSDRLADRVFHEEVAAVVVAPLEVDRSTCKAAMPHRPAQEPLLEAPVEGR